MIPAALLEQWVGAAAPAGATWLAERRDAVRRDGSALAAAFTQAPRRLGKSTLALSEAQLAEAETARPGWAPGGLTADAAGRILLLLDAGVGVEGLQAMVATADLGELVAIYRGLPLYPEQQSLLPLATAGLRTAMRPVFDAVAHGNPFPAEQFPQGAWNHMILKTLFIESVLYPIVGLDRRWNPELARMLIDYAHERRVAGRPISPELWRGVGRFADAAAVEDLRRLLEGGEPAGQRAAALALSESPHAAAASALANFPALADDAASGRIRWDDLR